MLNLRLFLLQDLSGRPHLSYDLQIPTERVGTYDTQVVLVSFFTSALTLVSFICWCRVLEKQIPPRCQLKLNLITLAFLFFSFWFLFYLLFAGIHWLIVRTLLLVVGGALFPVFGEYIWYDTSHSAGNFAFNLFYSTVDHPNILDCLEAGGEKRHGKKFLNLKSPSKYVSIHTTQKWIIHSRCPKVKLCPWFLKCKNIVFSFLGAISFIIFFLYLLIMPMFFAYNK